MPMATSDPSLLNVARVIQLALTPIFLLSGIAALLNVFSGRLVRVSDQVDALTRQLDEAKAGDEADHLQRQLRSLSGRSHLLDVAVVSGAAGGLATGVSVMTLFIGALSAVATDVLFLSFGGGVVLTIVAIAFYLAESLLASRGVRREVARAEQTRAAKVRLPHLWWGSHAGDG